MNAPNIIRSTPVAKKTVLILFIFEDGGYLKIFEIQHNKTLIISIFYLGNLINLLYCD